MGSSPSTLTSTPTCSPTCGRGWFFTSISLIQITFRLLRMCVPQRTPLRPAHRYLVDLLLALVQTTAFVQDVPRLLQIEPVVRTGGELKRIDGELSTAVVVDGSYGPVEH